MTPTVIDPVATIEAVEPMPDTDGQRVTVVLENRGETGLTSVQVVVRCGGLDRSLEFLHVPASGRRTGTVVCPAETDPEASVETWIGV